MFRKDILMIERSKMGPHAKIVSFTEYSRINDEPMKVCLPNDLGHKNETK